MLVEGALAVVVVLACTAGLGSAEVWHGRYADWGTAQSLGAKLSAFVDGAAYFMSHVGFSEDIARTLVTVTVIGFALTSLYSATRLLRFIVAEVGERARVAPLKNRFLASATGGESVKAVFSQLLGTTQPIEKTKEVPAIDVEAMETSAAPPAPAEGGRGFSFDDFFGGGGEEPPAEEASPPASDLGPDNDEFKDWLKGLKT